MKLSIYSILFSLFISCAAFADDVYVANLFSNSVTPVNGVTGALLSDIAVGIAPQETATSPGGDVIYVSNSNSYEILAIDAVAGAVKDRIAVSCSPASIAVFPSGTGMLAVCRTTGQLITIDLVQGKQTAAIPVSFPHSVTVAPDGKTAYVSRSMFSSYVDVIDLASSAKTATVTVGRAPQGMAVSPDGRFLYVANNSAGTVSVVETATRKVRSNITVGANPRNIAVSPDGSTIYVTNYTSGTVSVIDAATAAVAGTVTVGVNPHGIAVDSSGSRIYVSNHSSNTLSIIDAGTLRLLAVVPTGIGPLGVGLARVDRDAPVTVTTLAGVKGNNDWFVSAVSGNCAASDAGSGVREIHYSIDGAAEIVKSGSNAEFTVGTDGVHAVTCFAVDNAGNIEQARTLAVKVDQTPPTAVVVPDRSMLWPPNRKMVDVRVSGTSADSLSGVSAVEVKVLDEYGIYSGAISGFGGFITLEAWRNGNDKDGRRYFITAVVTDGAGNSSTAFGEVVVPHDMDR